MRISMQEAVDKDLLYVRLHQEAGQGRQGNTALAYGLKLGDFDPLHELKGQEMRGSVVPEDPRHNDPIVVREVLTELLGIASFGNVVELVMQDPGEFRIKHVPTDMSIPGREPPGGPAGGP